MNNHSSCADDDGTSKVLPTNFCFVSERKWELEGREILAGVTVVSQQVIVAPHNNIAVQLEEEGDQIKSEAESLSHHTNTKIEF